MHTILVPLQGTKSDVGTFAAATAAARATGAHIVALHVQPSPLALALKALPISGEAGITAGEALGEQWNEMKKQAKKDAAAARKSFGALCKASGVVIAKSSKTGVSAEWVDAEGDTVQQTIAHGRGADLIVLSRAPFGQFADIDDIGDILLSGGRPILIAPDASKKTADKADKGLIGRVAIAWKDSPEATRAVAFAMPFLKKAKKVSVLIVPEGDPQDELESAAHLMAGLARHGVKAELRKVSAKGKNPPDVALAAGEKADMLVMGGYGHSRTRELMLGGFTRRVLEGAKLPVLLSH